MPRRFPGRGRFPWPVAGRLLRGVILAAAYFVLLVLGSLFPAPGNAVGSILEPGAGLAVAGLALLGRRYWPAIAAGALSYWLIRGTGPVGAAVMAAAATVHAMIGGGAVRRRLLSDDSEWSSADVWYCFRYAGLYASAVFATIVALLLRFREGPAGLEFLDHWLSSFYGSVLGVSLVAPPLLLLARPRAVLPIRTTLRVTVPLALIASLLVAGHVMHDRLEVDRSRSRTENLVDGVHLQAALLLRTLGAMAEAFERYMVASEVVTDEEFRAFASPYLQHPGIRRIEWIARDGAALPVTLVATKDGESAPTGIDRAAGPEARAYHAAASAGRRGLYRYGNGNPDPRDTVLVVHPVFPESFQPAAAAPHERADSLEGVISIVADRGELFGDIEAAAAAAGLVIRLTDSAGQLLHRSGGTDSVPAENDGWLRAVTFGGQPLGLALTATRSNWHDTGTTVDRLLHATMTFATLFAAWGLMIGATQQAALSSSDRRFELLLENLDGMVYRRSHGHNPRFEFASEGSGAVLGIPPGELVAGRVRLWDLIHPEDRATVQSRFSEAMAGGESFRAEYRLLHADGGWRWVWDHASGVYDGGGTLRYIDGFIADITDRRNAEEALRRLTDELEARVADRTRDLEEVNSLIARQQEQLRTILDNLVECVIQIDGSGIIHSTNPALTRILGYTPEEVIGRNVAMLMPEPTRTEHDGYLERYTRTGGAKVVGFRRIVEGRHKSGNPVTIELSVNEYLEDGRRFYTGILRDIGEQRKAELERVRVTTLLNGVLQAAYEVAIIATGTDGTISVFNSGAERMLGYSASEVVGKHTPSLLHLPSELDARADELAAMLGRQVTWSDVLAAIPELEDSELGEWTYVHKNGTHIPVSLVVTAMRDENGEVVGFVCMAQNITRRRRMIRELADARDAAETANQAKSAFLATMSHEIRTPMNGIVGSVDVLLRASLTPRQTELARTIRDSASSLLGIIDDILDFSKIEAGRLEPRLEPGDPAAVIEDACVALQPLAARREVDLEVFADPRLPRSAFIDALRLRQIITNLVSNAVKFSAGRNELGRVRVEAVPHDTGMIRLTVTDNGIGMSREVVSRLFVPFAQADSSTTRRFGGTGLGLSIVKRLIEMMNGTITVTSRPGEGSTFTVTLPAAAAEDGEPAPARPLAGIDIIVVPGDPVSAHDWIRHLEHAGGSARSYRDIESALLAASRAANPETVVLYEGGPEVAAGIASLHGRLPRMVRVGGSEQRLPHRERPGMIHIGGIVTGGSLVAAVAAACGRISPETDPAEMLPRRLGVAALSVEDAEAAGRLILVAEDNDLNRKVIRLQLNALGHVAEFAESGTEALEMWRTGRYGLLLTDLHMPGLDGYELTDAVRREEGEVRKPIVVLTANALSGEEDRCLAAGMDAYLSKPVPLERLHETLERWLPPLPAVTSQPVNPSTLANLLGTDDITVLQDFLEGFRQSVTDDLPVILRSLLEGDAATAGATAHRLKSSARAAGAERLAAACAEAERIVADPAGFEKMHAIASLVSEAGNEILNWFEEYR